MQNFRILICVIAVAVTACSSSFKANGPRSDSPEAVWLEMKSLLIAKKLDQAMEHYFSMSQEKYREAFVVMGPEAAAAKMKALPNIVAVSIDGNSAQYRFDMPMGDT